MTSKAELKQANKILLIVFGLVLTLSFIFGLMFLAGIAFTLATVTAYAMVKVAKDEPLTPKAEDPTADYFRENYESPFREKLKS